jgi:predicted deacylase
MHSIKVEYSFLKILTGSDLSKRRLPTMLLNSGKSGPVVWLTGCSHGDEIGGTVVIQEVFKRIKKNLLKGAIYAFPLMNPSGFETMSRGISLSGEDLNRAFPGNPRGTLAQRIADKIFGEIIKTNPSLVLDLHNDWNKSIPYALLDPGAGESIMKSITYFSAVSGLPQVKDGDTIRNSLTYNLIQKNIPAFTMELGESLVINEKNIDRGICSILNILQALGMVEEGVGRLEPDVLPGYKGPVLNYSPLPLSSTSGIIRFVKKPGDIVRKGQRVACIINAFGKALEYITAMEDGIILGHADYAVAYPGAQVMAFGIKTAESKVSGLKLIRLFKRK